MASRRTVLALTLAALLTGALAAPLGAQAAPAGAHAAAVRAAAAVTAAARAVSGTVVARYDFDGGRSSSIPDNSGNGHTLRLIAGNGGTVRAVPHRSGQALRFPAKCTGSCPHAALQSPSSASLNPGTRAISFGASVLLAASQTSKGQNIVQKGYSTESSQWKLQVDGAAGRPSCVLVGANPGIKIVRSTVSVADGSWHTVECRRTSTALTVVVDGAVRGSRVISAKLSVANSRPLSIGGKGAYSDNDQFHGIIDDVWVRIG
ncbi:LamG-like jellyroll fold domain-containing protein [Actinoplanes sp. NPDC049548]|uniref:LamG-like jellyroll fold domain-containing protein n=1 Tax=Actinoplanes sp. NPDC049548 TaxID=3155152 RepID=UPI00343463E7